MSFTQAQVIQAARERVGNKITVSTSELGVPDPAVAAEMREDVLVCIAAFGGGTAVKQKSFVTVRPSVVATPAAPTLSPSESGGTLAAGSYQYRVSALSGTGETMAGPNAAAAATIAGSTGSIALTWAAVAEATGYNVYGRAQGTERFLATVAAGVVTWTDDGTAKRGGGVPVSDSANGGGGEGGTYLQDYELAAFLGDDVLEVTEVLRSDAYIPDFPLDPGGMADPRTGLATSSSGGRVGALVDFGLQRSAFDVALAQERWRHQSNFEFTILQQGGVLYLRLIPRPCAAITVVATYTTTGGTIATLPDDARGAVENSACRAFLDCMLNRFNSFPNIAGNRSEIVDRQAWVDLMQAQRDYYKRRFEAAVGRAT